MGEREGGEIERMGREKGWGERERERGGGRKIEDIVSSLFVCCYSDNLEREAEILVNWLPLLLDHLNYFINKFHSNNVALG